MLETIDVTGLPEPVVESLREVVDQLRKQPTTNQLSIAEWIHLWETSAKQHRHLKQPADDSRESIYAGRGE